MLQAPIRAAQAITAYQNLSGAYQAYRDGDYLKMMAMGTYGVQGLWQLLGPVCFAAGTPLLTPDGSKLIEQFQIGDLLLSRSEFDPSGPVEASVVEAVFRRLGEILHLHVRGQVIRTTDEHPFYVQSKGWVPARELHSGDLLDSHDGQWVAVQEVYSTGVYETVYNLRLAEFHTYFVGCGLGLQRLGPQPVSTKRCSESGESN